jgi:hypothetical protein
LSIDNLKLRGSYGVLGNQLADGYYPYIATMSSGYLGLPLNGSMPLYINQPGTVAGDLTWERVRTVNGGFDLSLLDNRVSISFDKYTRYTEGMLVQSKDLPNVFGADPPKTNAGDLETKGWELTLGLNNTWQVGGSPLYIGLNFMLADARSYITKYDNPTRAIKNGGSADYYEGQEIGEIWGFVNDGYLTKDDLVLREDGTPSGNAKIDQYDVSEEDNRSTGVSYEGDIKFKDLNGDGKINFGDKTVSNPGDRKIIGNDQARYPYSFDFSADWKGFDLRAFFQGVGKRDWYPSAGSIYFWGIYAQPWTNVTKQNLDHWTPENPNAYFPRVKSYAAEDTDHDLGAPQTRYLQDASYLRFKNLTLGYTLPQHLIQKLGMGRVRIYFSAENIFTVSQMKVSMDPEGLNGSGAYPFQKTYSFGINLNF